MIEQKATKKEWTFVIWLSHFQDEYGQIKGVNYNDMFCKYVNEKLITFPSVPVASKVDKDKKLMSPQTFYDVLISLQEKGVLRVEKNHYGDYDITILNNRFNDKDYGKDNGYISTAHNIFYSENFFSLSANEMILVMQVFNNCNITGKNTGKKQHYIGKNKFIEKYKRNLICFKGTGEITDRTLKRYIRSLKQFFDIKIHKGNYYFTMKDFSFYGLQKFTDDKNEREHFIKVFCRRSNIKFDSESLKDVITLFDTYKNKTKSIFLLIKEAVKDSIGISNKSINNKKQWKKKLHPALINSIMGQRVQAELN